MHIEIDVLEFVVLIFFYTLFKWVFRGVIIAVIVKVIDTVKKRGMEQIEGFKNQFVKKNDNEGDMEN